MKETETLEKMPYIVIDGYAIYNKLELLQKYKLSMLDFNDGDIKQGLKKAQARRDTYINYNNREMNMVEALLEFNGDKDKLMEWVSKNRDKVTSIPKSPMIEGIDIENNVIDCASVLEELLA